jgi:hypothetical protein
LLISCYSSLHLYEQVMNPRTIGMAMSAQRMIGRLAGTVALTAVLAGLTTGPAMAATPRIGPSVSPNTFTAYETGYGATLAAAEADAQSQFGGDYYGCDHNFFLFSSSQLADGSWTATMAERCTGWN